MLIIILAVINCSLETQTDFCLLCHVAERQQLKNLSVLSSFYLLLLCTATKYEKQTTGNTVIKIKYYRIIL